MAADDISIIKFYLKSYKSFFSITQKSTIVTINNLTVLTYVWLVSKESP